MNIFIRLQELQTKISALNTSKDTLERMCHNSRDEIQDIIAKLENISLEVKDIQGEQRVQSKMMETRENQLVSFILIKIIPLNCTLSVLWFPRSKYCKRFFI